MNETVLIIRKTKEIDSTSMQYLWATSYIPDAFNVVRVTDEKAAKDVLHNIGFTEIDEVTIPLLIYDGEIFTNIESIGNTISRNLRKNIGNTVIELLNNEKVSYSVDGFGSITLDRKIIQDNGGAVYEDSSKLRVDIDNNIFVTVWSISESKYVDVNIKDIKDDTV